MNRELMIILRQLIHGKRIAALGTLHQGGPFVSMVTYAAAKDGSLILHVSRLAAHTRDMGPSLGGLLVLWIGIGGCYAAFAASLVVSGLGMMLIRSNSQRVVNLEQNFLREFKEGFQYVWASPVILSSIVAAYTFAVFIVTYQGFLPVFAKEVLEVGPGGLGLLMAAPGIGGIASLTFLASAGERWDRAKLLWITTTVTPIFLILFCASPDFSLSVVLLAVVGAGQVSFRTISRVIIQIEAPRDLLGRAMSVFNMDQGMRSLGSIVMV